VLGVKEKFGVRLEKRPAPSLRVDIGISILSFVAALVACSPILSLLGYNPIDVYSEMFKDAFGGFAAIARTLTKAIPLILVSAGAALSFKAKIWNIGAQGQMIMGAIAATWVALFSPFQNGSGEQIALMLVLGILAGLAWGAICGFINEKIGVNMVITTLMFNAIAIKFLEYLLHGPWKMPAIKYPYTDPLPASSWLPVISDTTIHYPTLIAGIASVILLYLVLKRYKLGYEIRVFGENRAAAKYAGISSFKVIMIVMSISGALAGLAGVGEVAGLHHQLKMGVEGSGAVYAASYGYVALYIAWLGKCNPLGAAFASFLIAGVLIGGESLLVMGIQMAVVSVILGMALLLLMAGVYLSEYKIVRRRSVEK